MPATIPDGPPPAPHPTPAAPHRTPLHDRHAALGARFAPFGGWEMPLEYADGGVLREHEAVRTAVGVFDVSHLGKLHVHGPGAAAHVNAVLTNDLGRIAPGKAQYTLCCTESGGVLDDLIAYLRGPDDVLLIPNAANAAAVAEAVRTDAPEGVAVEDHHTDLAVIAVQGPHSADLLRRLDILADLDYMAFAEPDRDGAPLTVCRTGYTGEHGYELVLPAPAAGPLWDDLLRAGADLGVRPCGLGARDTLRTEMGYPLHGQDLGPDISPVQARLGWAVGWSKPAFHGRAALTAERAAGPARVLRGLEALDRGIPRPHMAVRGADAAADDTVGTVTSGTFSPTRRVGIALALVSPDVAEGDTVVVDVRGRDCRMRVVRPPFVDRSPA